MSTRFHLEDKTASSRRRTAAVTRHRFDHAFEDWLRRFALVLMGDVRLAPDGIEG
jgi:hypothetical protein